MEHPPEPLRGVSGLGLRQFHAMWAVHSPVEN